MKDLYPWGKEWPPPDRAGNYCDATCARELPNRATRLSDYNDGYPTTAPVMKFKPNKLGIYDLGGNVWEWCADWYDDSQKARVIRGASFIYELQVYLLSSGRHSSSPSARGAAVDGGTGSATGFRVVMEIE